MGLGLKFSGELTSIWGDEGVAPTVLGDGDYSELDIKLAAERSMPLQDSEMQMQIRAHQSALHLRGDRGVGVPHKIKIDDIQQVSTKGRVVFLRIVKEDKKGAYNGTCLVMHLRDEASVADLVAFIARTHPYVGRPFARDAEAEATGRPSNGKRGSYVQSETSNSSKNLRKIRVNYPGLPRMSVRVSGEYGSLGTPSACGTCASSGYNSGRDVSESRSVSAAPDYRRRMRSGGVKTTQL